MKFLALGDSYTIGESVNESERWPVILASKLRGIGVDVGDPEIIAKTGWTTDELKVAIEKADIQRTYDLVSLSIGVNNQYRGRNPEEFRSEYAELLDLAISFAGNNPENVIVISIPHWGLTPFAKGRDRDKIEAEIEIYNKAKKEETIKKGVGFIDISEISRKAAKDKSYTAKDGLHYSGKMHGLWVDEIIKARFN